MKRRLLLTGALCPLFNTVDAQAQPIALPEVLSRAASTSALATHASLLAAVRVGKRLIVAGERGIVLWSDDHGKQWMQARVPAQISMTSLSFSNEREGWATGHFGVLLRTLDAGQTWTLAMDGVRFAKLMHDQAPDDLTRQIAAEKIQQGADKPFFDLLQINKKIQAFGAYGLAVESIDGKTYTALSYRLHNPKQLHVYSVAAHKETIFAVGEQGLIMRSLDAGLTYDTLSAPYKGSFFGVLFTQLGTVLAYGLRGNIWRSSDKGTSWAQIENVVPVSINTGLVLADDTVVLVAQNGDVLTSRDQGQNFSRIAANPPFPTAAVCATADGHLLMAGLRGLKLLKLA